MLINCRIFQHQDVVSGIIVVNTKGALSHTGITLGIEGTITLSKNVKKDGLFEALVSAQEPIVVMQLSMDLAPAGRFPDGITEVPFEFPLTTPTVCDFSSHIVTMYPSHRTMHTCSRHITAYMLISSTF